MADRNGYIGRAPGDSSVVVARQIFNPTSSTTNFTFAGGYSTCHFCPNFSYFLALYIPYTLHNPSGKE